MQSCWRHLGDCRQRHQPELLRQVCNHFAAKITSGGKRAAICKQKKEFEMEYKCSRTGTNCGWNVPADTGGCVCAMPQHQQNALVEIKQISDYRDLKRVANLVEAELAFEISKAFPSQSRLDRIADLQNEIRTNA